MENSDTDAYELQFRSAGLLTLNPYFNRLPNYVVQSVAIEDFIQEYPTNFGLLDYENENYASSQVKVTIEVRRSVSHRSLSSSFLCS